jgi:acyl-CoA synthetase (AMP-forming)/AMP-acid ligase II
MESLQSQKQQDRRGKRQYRHKVTIGELLSRELRRDGARPFLTWYDDATGDRVELSVATTANWAAKIANFLTDELDVQPGDAVTVDPALHWTTAVVLLGAWTAGGHVRFGSPPTLEFAPDAMGVGLSRLVGGQPDEVVVPVVVAAEPALTLGTRTWSHDELGEAAARGAQTHGWDASSRVLSTRPLDTVDGLDAGLLVPLAAGGSAVLVANVDSSRVPERVTAERITHSV